jgi:hypothetical protein
MPVELHEELGGKILALTLTGTLTRQDYEHFTPVVERAVETHGKIRLLVQMTGFHGWTLGALWDDLKFDIRHFSQVERLAMVGDHKWESWMAMFCKPFTTAEIRYFDQNREVEADDWVHEGVELALPTA